jgi:hypothetical protein
VRPIAVVGSGTQGSPFTVIYSYGGKTGCEGVALCVADHLGPGLMYENGQIRVRVSSDPDNAVTTGTDGGVKVGEKEPNPNVCPTVDVATACERPGLLVGAARLGLLANPSSAPYAVDYCLSKNVDVLHAHVWATADGAAVVADEEDGVVSPSRHAAVFPWADTDNGTTAVTETAKINEVTVGAWRAAWSIAGHASDPEILDNNDPAQPADRKGGWWGWLASNYTPMRLDDMLSRVDGRAIVLADCNATSRRTGQDTADNVLVEAANVRAAVRAGVRWCAQKWMLVGVRNLVNAPIATAAGFQVCAITDSEGPVKNTSTAPWAVADLSASNVGWVALDKQYADSVFSLYTSNGRRVMMWRCDRHTERTRAQTLNLCGYLSHDPEYTRGPLAGAKDYRRLSDPYTRKTMGVGTLTHKTSRGLFTSLTGTGARGWSEEDVPALYLEKDFGSLNDYGTPSFRFDVLADAVPFLENFTSGQGSVHQQIAYDAVGQRMYVSQVMVGGFQLPGEDHELTFEERAANGDMVITRMRFDGTIDGAPMFCRKFGHGWALSVERVGSNVFIWAEGMAELETGSDPFFSFGTQVARYQYVPGAVLDQGSPGVTYYDPLPRPTGTAKLMCSVDFTHNRIAVSVNTTPDTQRTHYVYDLTDFKAGTFTPLIEIPQVTGASIQGFCLYSPYLYQSQGSAYSTGNPPSGNTLMTVYSIFSGEVVERGYNYTRTDLPHREPESLNVWEHPDGPRLMLGFGIQDPPPRRIWVGQLPSIAGSSGTIGTFQMDRPSVLMGWACPLADAATYRIEWEFKFLQRPNPVIQGRSMMGVVFGQAGDWDIFQWRSGWPYTEQLPQAYLAYVRPDGRMGVGMWPSSGDLTFRYMSGGSSSTDPAGMEQTIPLPAETSASWTRCRLDVSATSLTFTANVGGGTGQRTVTVTGAQATAYRGGYLYLLKQEPGGLQSNQAARYVGGFRNVVVTP